MVAIFNADVWCDECAEKIKRSLAKEIIVKLRTDSTVRKFLFQKRPQKENFPHSGVADVTSEVHEALIQALIDVCDKDEMDSDDWPSCGHPTEATDSPQHCGADEACETAEVLSDGRKVGALLGTELTEHGVNYLNEMLGEFHESNVSLHAFWREQFDSYELIPDPTDEEE